MRYRLYQKFFGKMVKIKEISFLSTRGMGLMFGNCKYFPGFLRHYSTKPIIDFFIVLVVSKHLLFAKSFKIFHISGHSQQKYLGKRKNYWP